MAWIGAQRKIHPSDVHWRQQQISQVNARNGHAAGILSEEYVQALLKWQESGRDGLLLVHCGICRILFVDMSDIVSYHSTSTVLVTIVRAVMDGYFFVGRHSSFVLNK
jgi:hypothetical protein